MDDQLELILTSYSLDDISNLSDINPVSVLKLMIEEGWVDIDDYIECPGSG